MGVVAAFVDVVETVDATPVGAAVEGVDPTAPPMTVTTPCIIVLCTSQKYGYVPSIINLAVNVPEDDALPELK